MRHLTKIEKKEVVRFLSFGMPNRVIAETLNLDVRQINRFRKNNRLTHIYRSSEMSPYTLLKFSQVLDKLTKQLAG